MGSHPCILLLMCFLFLQPNLDNSLIISQDFLSALLVVPNTVGTTLTLRCIPKRLSLSAILTNSPSQRESRQGTSDERGGEALFVLNGVKLLPQRDLSLADIDNREDVQTFVRFLGQWFYVENPLGQGGFFVNNLLNSRYEWYQLVLGSRLGEGLYKIREATLSESDGVFTLRMIDFDQVVTLDSRNDFMRSLGTNGVLTEQELRHYLEQNGENWRAVGRKLVIA